MQTSKKSYWNNTVVLSIIFLVALVARVPSMILDPVLQRDAALYISIAEKWQETGDYTQATQDMILPPVPCYTINKMMDLGFNSEISGRSLVLFLGSFIPVLGYYISYKLFGNFLTSAISAFLFVFQPRLISYSTQPLRENFYLFFLGLTILAFINGIKEKKIINWITCGVCIAFSLFSRYEAFELLVFCPIVMSYLFVKRKINLYSATVSMFVLYVSVILTSFLIVSITDFDTDFYTKIILHINHIFTQNNA